MALGKLAAEDDSIMKFISEMDAVAAANMAAGGPALHHNQQQQQQGVQALAAQQQQGVQTPQGLQQLVQDLWNCHK